MPFATEKALRVAALDAVAIVQDRVQQAGDGTKNHLLTRSLTGNGIYSKSWMSARRGKGLQVAKVDLTFDGDLWLNWQLLSSDTKTAEIGFMSDRVADIAGYLEDYYGDEIFALREPTEQDDVWKSFDEEFEKNFKIG